MSTSEPQLLVKSGKVIILVLSNSLNSKSPKNENAENTEKLVNETLLLQVQPHLFL